MTEALLIALTLLQQGTLRDASKVRAELQGLYDEISQASLRFVGASDVDLFHDVLYTPDWVFVETTGQKQTWLHVRERVIQALSATPLVSMRQPIQKLSLVPDGATVVVHVTTVSTIVDTQGWYGREGASHTLTETTAFRDDWVRVSDEWKWKSRRQLAEPTVSVDSRPPYSEYLRKYHVRP